MRTPAEIAVIILFFVAFCFALFIGFQEAFGAVSKTEDVMALSARIPYSEEVEVELHAKLNEMREHLYRLGCRKSAGFAYREKGEILIYLTCQDTK